MHYCSKKAVRFLFWAQFSMYIDINLLFLRNPSNNSLVVEAMVGFSDSYLFFFVQIYHKNSFSYHLRLVRIFFCELILFSSLALLLYFQFSFMDFLKFWLLWILFWKVRSFYLRNIILNTQNLLKNNDFLTFLMFNLLKF